MISAKDLEPTKTIIDPDAPKHRGIPESPVSIPNRDDDNPVALALGAQLHEYRIDAVLGCGAFGITYLAYDAHLQTQVAIKEYLPGELAQRSGKQSVCARTSSDIKGFKEGLERFLTESRVLATFRHPNIVRVRRFFEANGTAYMVMDYEKGQPLKEWLKSHTPLSEEKILQMFLPLLDGLEMIHSANFLHRDIKPSNIFVRESDGSLVLLDFGSARQTLGNDRSLTTIVTPGYAPFEQYYNHGSQGKWSDLYALGAVLYWVVTGNKPLEAPARVKNDNMPKAQNFFQGRYSKHLLGAIDWSLRLDETQRPQSVAEFKAALTNKSQIPTTTIIDLEKNISQLTVKTDKTPFSNRAWLAIYVVTLSVISLIGVITWKFVAKNRAQYNNSIQSTTRTNSPLALGNEEHVPSFNTFSKNGPSVKEIEETTSPQQTPVQPNSLSVATPNTKNANQQKISELEANTKSSKINKKVPSQSSENVSSGSLSFDVVPNGQVFIDGKKIGSVPNLKRFSLSPGIHKVQILGCGFPPRTYHLNIDVKANSTKHIQLNCPQ